MEMPIMEQFFLVGWSALLTAFVAVVGFVAHEKNEKLKDLETKVNNARVEVARENATKTEIAQLVEHFDTRFNRLEVKIDGLIQKG